MGGHSNGAAGSGQGQGGDLFLYNTGVTFTGSGTSSLSDPIDGPGYVVLNGPGTLMLSGNSGYNGGTSITGGGTLNVRADSNLGDTSGAVTLDNGTLQTSAGVSFDPNRNMVLGLGNGTIDTLGHVSLWNGVVSGSGGLTVTDTTGSGLGVVALTNSNTYTGGTYIDASEVSVNSDSSLGATSGAVSLNYGALQTLANVSFDPARNLVLTGPGAIDVNGYSSTWQGQISGTGTLYVFAGHGTSGTLTLTAANNYTGGTYIESNATLNISADNNLGSTNGPVTLNNGTLQTSVGVAFDPNRNMVLGSGNGTFDTLGHISSWNGVISGSGGFSLVDSSASGSGALTLTNNNTYTGLTDISGARLVLGVTNALNGLDAVQVESTGLLDLNNHAETIGSLSGSGGVTLGTGSLNVGSNNLGTLFSGNISSAAGAGGLTKVGSGALTLAGVNSYSGGTTVLGGALGVYGDSNLGLGDVALANGGALQTLNSGMHLTKDISLLTGGGTIDTTGKISLLDGVISGNNSLSLVDSTGSGNGLVALTNSGNSYNGGTYIDGVIVSVGTDSDLGAANGAVTLINNGWILTSAGVNFNSNRNLVLSGPGVIDLEGNDSTWQGQISGSGMLYLVSTSTAATLTLSGSNTYTGGTSIIGVFAGVSSDGNLGDAGGILYLADGGGLKTLSGVTFDPNRRMWLNGSGSIDLDGNDSTWQGQILGSGGLYVWSSSGTNGALTLTAGNNYSGGTTIGSNGTLNVDSDGNLGYVTGQVTLQNGTLQTSSGIIFDTNRNMNLSPGTQGTFDTQGYTSYWNGTVNGSGGLNILGGGTLYLTNAANTYSGGTSVSGGAIVNVVSDGNLGAPTGAVTLDNGTLQTSAAVPFNSNRNMVLGAGNGFFDTWGNNSSWNGAISGSGSLVKVDTGNLTLNGINSYTGGTLVDQGALIVGDSNSSGALIQGPVTVTAGCLLGGYGAVNGAVTNLGVVKPAGTSGTLTIAHLDEGPGSQLEIEVLPANNQCGRLYVGSANLAGGVTVVEDNPDSFGIRYRYIILSSATALTTTFDSVTDSSTFLTPSLSYGSNAITLTLFRNNVDFASLFAQTPNQLALAGVLNQSIPTASDEFIDKLNSLYVLPGDQGRAALDQISGSFYTPLAGIMLNNNLFATQALLQHADGSGFSMPSVIQSLVANSVASEISQNSPAVSPGFQAAAAAPRLWVESLVSSGSVDGNSNVTGYNTRKYGFMAAYDSPLNQNFKAGFSAGYNRLFLDSSDSGSSKTQTDNYLLGIYGGPCFGGWDFTVALQYGWDHYLTNRTVSLGSDSILAQASFDGAETSAAFQISCPLLDDHGFNLKPTAGIQYTRLTQNGFTETGAGTLDLTLTGQAYDSLRPQLGVNGSGNINLGGNTMLVPMAHLTASREMMNFNPQAQASLAGVPGLNYKVTGLTPDATLFGVGAGAKLITGRGFNLYAAYFGDFGGNQISNAFHGGASFNF